ncbi:MAG: type II 3-dehydroquinate dehydratase [Pseudomonadota bacterium]
MAALLLLNGPNLNLLGQREPDIYGHETLADLNEELTTMASEAGHTLECFQSNHEGALIDKIHARTDADMAICNFGALTHTGIGLRDALLGTELPFIEVHISNVHAREAFRHHSYFSDIAVGTIVGLGTLGYALALQAAMHAADQL